MSDLTPESFFDGAILVLAPHMDDDLLGCGGMLATLAGKQEIRVLFCTDGRGILQPGRGPRQRRHGEERIGDIRREETLAGLAVLGVPAEAARFLPFPEWKLAEHRAALADELRRAVTELRPRFVFAPFRFDKHPDHVVLNNVVRESQRGNAWNGFLLEYLVYRQWKLLPAGDVRAILNPAHVRSLPLDVAGQRKRQALECHTSQTTAFYPWQPRPVLSPELLDAFCSGTEDYVCSERPFPDSDVVTMSPRLLTMLNWLEPRLKNAKERVRSFLHRPTGAA